jgi:hypothetical protein
MDGWNTPALHDSKTLKIMKWGPPDNLQNMIECPPTPESSPDPTPSPTPTQTPAPTPTPEPSPSPEPPPASASASGTLTPGMYVHGRESHIYINIIDGENFEMINVTNSKLEGKYTVSQTETITWVSFEINYKDLSSVSFRLEDNGSALVYSSGFVVGFLSPYLEDKKFSLSSEGPTQLPEQIGYWSHSDIIGPYVSFLEPLPDGALYVTLSLSGAARNLEGPYEIKDGRIIIDNKFGENPRGTYEFPIRIEGDKLWFDNMPFDRVTHHRQ